MVNKTKSAESVAELNMAMVAIANNRDQAAYTVLFKKMLPRLKQFTYQKLHDTELTIEVVQEAMLLVWNKAHLFDIDKGNATTWIYTIVRNLIYDTLTKQKKTQNVVSSDVLWDLVDEEKEKVDSDIKEIQHRELENIVNTLPDKQKQIVQLVYLEEKSHQEVANITQLPLGTVKSRLRLALEKIRRLM